MSSNPRLEIVREGLRNAMIYPEASVALSPILMEARMLLNQQVKEIAAAERERDEAVKALAFYADKKSWHGRVGDEGTLVEPLANEDAGKRARDTIATIKEPKP